MKERYQGKHGRENWLDDYVFGPIFLAVFVFFTSGTGFWLFGEVGLLAGAIMGFVLDTLVVWTEMRLRRRARSSHQD